MPARTVNVPFALRWCVLSNAVSYRTTNRSHNDNFLPLSSRVWIFHCLHGKLIFQRSLVDTSLFVFDPFGDTATDGYIRQNMRRLNTGNELVYYRCFLKMFNFCTFLFIDVESYFVFHIKINVTMDRVVLYCSKFFSVRILEKCL